MVAPIRADEFGRGGFGHVEGRRCGGGVRDALAVRHEGVHRKEARFGVIERALEANEIGRLEGVLEKLVLEGAGKTQKYGKVERRAVLGADEQKLLRHRMPAKPPETRLAYSACEELVPPMPGRCGRVHRPPERFSRSEGDLVPSGKQADNEAHSFEFAEDFGGRGSGS